MTPKEKFDLSSLPESPDLTFEVELWREGRQFIAGVDEAGRGALAGPVAAGAVVLSGEATFLTTQLVGVRDSKVMSADDRERWAAVIKKCAVSWGVGFASANEIDQVGIVPATWLAASRALKQLDCSLDHILVDYLTLPDIQIPQTALVKGDARSLSIAAASILAKTARDAILVEMGKEFPGYDFGSNKGYGTLTHRKAIATQGPCMQHRCSFSPVAAYYSLFPPGNSE